MHLSPMLTRALPCLPLPRASVFVIGVSSGVIENFAYVRLRECGGEGTVMGVSRLFSSLTGVPMFWFSGEWAGRQPATDGRRYSSKESAVYRCKAEQHGG